MLRSGKFPQTADICPECSSELADKFKKTGSPGNGSCYSSSALRLESPCVADLLVEPLDFKLCILLRLLI